MESGSGALLSRGKERGRGRGEEDDRKEEWRGLHMAGLRIREGRAMFALWRTGKRTFGNFGPKLTFFNTSERNGVLSSAKKNSEQ